MSKKNSKNKPPKGNGKHSGGRPQKRINWKEFDGLCALFATLDEIASFFKCSEDTIERAVKRDKGMSFADYFKQRSPAGKISLRRIQLRLAKKNGALAIFLGKNYLGQKDVTTHTLFDPTKCTMEQLERIANGEDPSIVLQSTHR